MADEDCCFYGQHKRKTGYTPTQHAHTHTHTQSGQTRSLRAQHKVSVKTAPGGVASSPVSPLKDVVRGYNVFVSDSTPTAYLVYVPTEVCLSHFSGRSPSLSHLESMEMISKANGRSDISVFLSMMPGYKETNS